MSSIKIRGSKGRLEDLNLYRVDTAAELTGRVGVFGWEKNNTTLKFNNWDVKILVNQIFMDVFKSKKIAVECSSKDDAEKFMHNYYKYNDFNFWEDVQEHLRFLEKKCYLDYSSSGSDLRGFNDDSHIKDYTILRFQDLYFPEKEEDYMGEFIEYWKGHRVAVKFDNLYDKKKFYHLFGGEATNKKFLYTFWSLSSGIDSFGERYSYKDMYKIIQYKDLKDWKKILLGGKNMTYKIVKPISIKSIMEAGPCNSDGEVERFIKQLLDNKPYDYEIKTWGEAEEYPVLVEYTGWLENKGFIKRALPGFTPFHIEIKTVAEAHTLLAMLNYKDEMECIFDKYNKHWGKGRLMFDECYKLWEDINKELTEQGCR